MKLRLLKNGTVNWKPGMTGDVVECDERTGRSLVAAGRAVEVEDDSESTPPAETPAPEVATAPEGETAATETTTRTRRRPRT